MNSNCVARIVVGTLLLIMFSTMMGCSSHYAKGEGSLFESHMYIGKAPMSHQWGVNPAFGPAAERPGPADSIAEQEIVDPNPRVVVSSGQTRREARD